MGNVEQTEMQHMLERVEYLEKENRYLKDLLDRAGIFYEQIVASKHAREEAFNPNQGARIQHVEITDELANRFFSRFWGRQDVYSKRSVKKGTGEAGYYPQCNHFWSEKCPRKTGKKIKCRDCSSQSWKKLNIAVLKKHLEGKAADASDVIGIYPLLPDDTCRFLVFDFDNHEKDAGKEETQDTNEKWKEEVEALREICRLNGIDALTERSRSGRGAHVWIFFQSAVDASLARKFGFALLEKGAESVNLKSFEYYDRMLPAQDHIPDGGKSGRPGLGNLIALPLQGQALKEGNSAFIDENWNAYPDQWGELFRRQRLSKEFMETCIKNWQPMNPFEETVENQNGKGQEQQVQQSQGKQGKERVKPWEQNREFLAEDVDVKLVLTLSNLIYVDASNLKPRIQNRIRRMAAFANPVFYKNQAMGLSNFANGRYIYLGQDENGYIGIPRGLWEELIEKCEKAEIIWEAEDERVRGNEIKVEFNGQLRETQAVAAEKMLAHETGILSAATAFGKTVVCSYLIATRKVSTLILLESSSLIEQWQEALLRFLMIDEELPEYRTPSGQTRKRKSIIGKLQGAHDSMTGIIDIAMAGSLYKKEEFHPKLQDYGMVIVDECHHAASDTIMGILREVKAKYVYGVTATPMRGDGLEKITYRMIGPVRYSYGARDMAKEQGIRHFVYPRFTRTVSPHRLGEQMHVNEAYKLIRDNDMRNEQIAADVRLCIEKGRSPVVLSKYKEHARLLYERLKEYADRAFLLLGDNPKKEQKKLIEEMKQVSQEQSVLLVATGQLIGEGFDYPRLDTLIMAMPVAWKGVVEQYAGRLNREYEGKETVIVYDYVDRHIPVFDRMYAKRLRAYKQIGYEICTGIETATAKETNAIFDIDNYGAVYRQDLLGASKAVVISSPGLRRDKVHQMIELLGGQQEKGVLVTIVTWHPDTYKFGSSEARMNLMEGLRQAGFQVRLVDDSCEHYTIIDREIVWYGSVNFLSKEDAEDNLMRVCSGKIAEELLEMTFGGEESLEVW